jgi:hypothetical protein
MMPVLKVRKKDVLLATSAGTWNGLRDAVVVMILRSTSLLRVERIAWIASTDGPRSASKVNYA